MKTLKTLVLLIFCHTAFSQTRLIAYKSHSGAAYNLEKALLSASAGDNFGIIERPVPGADYRRIDSVIYVSENKTIVVSINQSWENDSLVEKRFRETVSDPLYSKKNSVEKIKEQMQQRYYRGLHETSPIVFVGFDTTRATPAPGFDPGYRPFSDTIWQSDSIKNTKNELIPPASSPGNSGTPPSARPYLFPVIVFLLLAVIAWLQYRRIELSKTSLR